MNLRCMQRLTETERDQLRCRLDLERGMADANLERATSSFRSPPPHFRAGRGPTTGFPRTNAAPQAGRGGGQVEAEIVPRPSH